MAHKEQLRQSIVEELRRFAANSVLYNQAAAAKTGLHGTDLECMEQLVLHGAQTAGALSKQLGLATGSVTALIDRLERAGYVQREHGKSDRRQVLVVPNIEKFEAEIQSVTTALGSAMEEVMADYSKGDLKLILDFIAKSNEVTAAEIARLRS